MKITYWKEIAELTGIAAIVASLVFVGLQLRQEQEIAVSQIYADWDDTRIEWARLINENDDVWIRGLSGDDLSEHEKLRFESVATAWYHMGNGRYIRSSRISLATPEAIARYAAAFIHEHAGLKNWWIRRYTYRASLGSRNIGFTTEVNRVLAEFDTGERPSVEQDSFVPL